MSALFESTIINNMQLKNRFVRSATWEGMATKEGFTTPKMIELLDKLARGGVGLIISGHAYVSREGQASAFQLGIYSDEHIPGLTQMTGAIHSSGGKIAAQLAHGGIVVPSHFNVNDPIGPSMFKRKSGMAGREMTETDIEKLTIAFALAAGRAKKAGFDGIQIHAAHGYLLSQFLSPFFNKRKDEYGGSIENRVKFVLKVLKAIRETVGSKYPILIKLNSEDFVQDGFTVDDMLFTAKKLEEAGIDAIEMSGGTVVSGDKNPSRPGKPRPGEPEAYYAFSAKKYKENIHVPLMLVGGIRNFKTAESLVKDGQTDYISLCRPLIREPDLINRWQSGDTKSATCISDNGCFKPGSEGKGIYCTVDARG